MYRKGDFVTYGCKGVCQVKDITTLSMDGVPKDKLYYELQPLHDTGSKIFTPVEHEASRSAMRPMLSEDEAEALLEGLEELDEIWIADDRAREANYRETINHCDAKGMLAILRSLYLRRKDRMSVGRKLTAMDSRYLRIAQENLYTELSLALCQPETEITERIEGQLEKLWSVKS